MNFYLIRLIKITVKIIFSPTYYLKITSNDLRSFFGKKFGSNRTIFIAGYPKSGTTWVENFISNIPGYSPRILYGSRETLRQHNLPYNAFRMIPSFGYSAIKTHILPNSNNIKILKENKVDKVVIMYRDPRDIAVSQYFHVLKNNPWLATDSFYADYSEMTKDSAMQHSIDMIVNDYSLWVKGWLSIKEKNSNLDCMLIKYEDLRINYVEIFHNLLSFYGVSLSDKQFNNVLLKSNKKTSKSFFSFLIPRNPGLKSTRRKGLTGEWKIHLNEEHKDCVKSKLGDLLIELGYENDHNW